VTCRGGNGSRAWIERAKISDGITLLLIAIGCVYSIEECLLFELCFSLAMFLGFTFRTCNTVIDVGLLIG
jgi:hypothetical protein